MQIILGNWFIRPQVEYEEIPESRLIKARMIGYYFGAYWAPPCRVFCEKLIRIYTRVNAFRDLWRRDPNTGEWIKPLEIIYYSWDRTNADFVKYFAKMPWLTQEIDLDERA
jgi:hypothetical protein